MISLERTTILLFISYQITYAYAILLLYETTNSVAWCVSVVYRPSFAASSCCTGAGCRGVVEGCAQIAA